MIQVIVNFPNKHSNQYFDLKFEPQVTVSISSFYKNTQQIQSPDHSAYIFV